jgi:hypothetical protein
MVSIPQSPAVSRKSIDRFWARVAQSDACWIWTGARLPNGYGRVTQQGKQVYTHRLAWELTHGPIPDGLVVCHSCDNPPCCNPAHLWLGTPADNVHDRDAKGRGRRSHRATSASRSRGLRRRLTREQMQTAATEVRQRYAEGGISARQLAKELGYSHSSVLRILRGEYRY